MIATQPGKWQRLRVLGICQQLWNLEAGGGGAELCIGTSSNAELVNFFRRTWRLKPAK